MHKQLPPGFYCAKKIQETCYVEVDEKGNESLIIDTVVKIDDNQGDDSDRRQIVFSLKNCRAK